MAIPATPTLVPASGGKTLLTTNPVPRLRQDRDQKTREHNVITTAMAIIVTAKILVTIKGEAT